ncbi:hypothetical protein NBRC111894_740 [Sporolactobacillus inulinus]|uniref:Uncharacterized protein n=2 Tax=Sporolactobacillus inulinus TaxID=2078 RepID=A0A4Y1Z8A8_9BACL|nr:hypothetical protein NBRC111894_740 [Sporolactobacillus inulinus]
MPSGVFQKYIKFVIGLVLIIALMDPVIRLFHVDPSSLLQGINTQKYDEPVKKETARQKSENRKGTSRIYSRTSGCPYEKSGEGGVE